MQKMRGRIMNFKEDILIGEANLNRLFPKGDKRRGQALLVYATAILSERARIDKIINTFNFKLYIADNGAFMYSAMKKALIAKLRENK